MQKFDLSSYDGFASHTYELSGNHTIKTNSIAPLPLLKNPTQVRIHDLKLNDATGFRQHAAANRGCAVNSVSSLFHMDSPFWISDNAMMARQVLWTSQDEVDQHPFLEDAAALMDDAYFTPGSISSLPDGFAQGCVHLSAVALPFGLTDIGTSAFCECRSLRTLVVPGSVSAFQDGAFEHMPAECSVYFTTDSTSQIPLDTQKQNLGKAFDHLMKSSSGFSVQSQLPEGLMTFSAVPEHEHNYANSTEIKYGESFIPLSCEYSGEVVAKYDICWEGASTADLYEFAYDCATGPLTLLINVSLMTLAIPLKVLIDSMCSGILQYIKENAMIKDDTSDKWSVTSSGELEFEGGMQDSVGKMSSELEKMLTTLNTLQSGMSTFFAQLRAAVNQAASDPEKMRNIRSSLGFLGDIVPDCIIEMLESAPANSVINQAEAYINAMCNITRNMILNPPISVRSNGIRGSLGLNYHVQKNDLMCVHKVCDYPGCELQVEYNDYASDNRVLDYTSKFDDSSFSISPWYETIGEIVGTILPGIDGRLNALDSEDFEKIKAREQSWAEEFVSKAKAKCIEDIDEQIDATAAETQAAYDKLEGTEWSKPCEHHDWTVNWDGLDNE